MDVDYSSLLKCAISAGLKPNEFWDLTPEEFNLIMEVHEQQTIDKVNELLFMAWHVEAFARQKKLPKLTDVLKNKNYKRREMTEKQMYDIVVMLNTAYGGDVDGSCT